MLDSTIIYEGDPRLFLSENGSTMDFRDGQPVMDRGLENFVLICLFTREGWPGNILFKDPNQKIGSDFELVAQEPITSTSLSNLEAAAKRALDQPVLGEIMVAVTNPVSHRLDVSIFIQPPGGDLQAFLLTKNGLNWTFQVLDPANLRSNL